ncbi:MAG: hypothetical protein R2940_07960 [Syntrophotaleaceae bacterium]
MLDIIFRTCHIGVAGILLGGAVFQASMPHLHHYAWLVVASGLALIGTELHHSLYWPHEGRGLLAMAHMLPVALVHFWPDYCVELLWFSIVAGTVGSHMPRRLRHWSLIYGKLKS